MTPGDNIMEQFLRFEDLCIRLASVGDEVSEDEKFLFCPAGCRRSMMRLSGLLKRENMWICTRAEKMLRRECDTMIKREKQESAFKAVASRGQPRGRRNSTRGHRNTYKNQEKSRQKRQEKQGPQHARVFTGRCYECDEGVGHKRDQCPTTKDASKPFVFLVASDGDMKNM